MLKIKIRSTSSDTTLNSNEVIIWRQKFHSGCINNWSILWKCFYRKLGNLTSYSITYIEIYWQSTVYKICKVNQPDHVIDKLGGFTDPQFDVFHSVWNARWANLGFMVVQNDVENPCKSIYYYVHSNNTIKFVLPSIARDVHEKDPELKEKELS